MGRRSRLSNTRQSLFATVLVLAILISAGTVKGQSGVITLDAVDTISTGIVDTAAAITFSIRWNNNSGSAITGFTNGFRIYSPDGAIWFATDTGAFTGAITFGMVGQQFINLHSVDGVGADTIGFGGFTIFGTGIPDGFNDIAYTITIDSIPTSSIGKQICIDSAYYPPAGVWKWSTNAGDAFPTWDGPHCFVIATCDSSGNDTDQDGISDICDNCPQDYNPAQQNSDGDGLGDLCDPCPNDPNNDIDGDSICVPDDNCPVTYNPDQLDADADSVGDSCDNCPGFDDRIDNDGDGVPDGCDQCPGFDDGIDTDSDSVPDGCDKCPGFDDRIDSDSDGAPDGCDKCPGFDDNIDSDGDGAPDSCDICWGFDDFADSDGDDIPDSCDNCPTFYNLTQIDRDIDGIGDVCDFCPLDPENDIDADSICGDVDNCPDVYNPLQVDSDGDGTGDACEFICGDVSGDGIGPDISDLTYLVDYMFHSGPPPQIMDAADMNNSGDVDITDLTHLVDYMYFNGAAPVCP